MRLHVFFQKKGYHFINRLLLPEYVSEELSWEALEKLKKGRTAKVWNINLPFRIRPYLEMIEKNKTIMDDNGFEYFR